MNKMKFVAGITLIICGYALFACLFLIDDVIKLINPWLFWIIVFGSIGTGMYTISTSQEIKKVK